MISAWQTHLRLLAAVLLAVSARADEPAAPRYTANLEFRGNEAIRTTLLQRALGALVSDLRQSGIDSSSVDDAVYELASYYRARGFPVVSISADFETSRDAFTIRFQIVEGPRSYLERLRIRGAQHFPRKELRSCFNWEPSGLLGFGDSVFTPGALDEGVSCVESRYQLEGFYFVQVDARTTRDAAGKTTVRVTVVEGPQVYLKERVRFQGTTHFPEDELREALGLSLPVVFVPRLPLVLKGKILDYYRTRGYRFADVRVERQVDRDRAEAFVSILVTEGPLTRIHDISIEGQRHTLAGVIEGRVKLQANDIYNEDLLRRSHRSLLRSGLFESVNLETTPVEGTEDRVHLKVRVKEKPRYKISLLAGYGSWEQLRGSLALEDTNIFGTGHRVRLEGRTSFKGERVSLEYANPYFFSDRVSQNARGFYERREQPSFTTEEIGGDTGFGFRLTNNVQTRLFYVLRQSELLEARSGVPEELQEDALISSVNLSAVYDDRVNFVNPEKGVTCRVTLEYSGAALGSELDFLRSTASGSWVLPVAGRLRLVSSVRLGAIARLRDTDVIPIQERFFSGGDSTIRSFKEDEAGPRVNDEPIGGESFLVFNLELRHPVRLLPILDDLDVALFADPGTVNVDLKDFGGDRYFVAVGTGLRYNTPVGPFRVDFAFNPDRDGDEDLFVFHFGLGYPF